MKFTKMHGLGNDFIVINCMTQEVKDSSTLAQVMCDRHFGVGGNGVILILPSTVADADFRMTYINADGSEGEMCGNALRCFAKYVYEKRLTNSLKVRIETRAGIKEAWLNVRDGKVVSVSTDLGVPRLKRKEVPVALGDPDDVMLEERIRLEDGEEVNLSAINTGPPHAVMFVDDVESIEVCKMGRLIRQHEIFPRGVNVNFAQVLAKNVFKVRTYERGVEDETMACGTGAAAVSVTASLLGIAPEDSIKVVFRGGELSVKLVREKGWIRNVLLTGPAVTVFEGRFLLDAETINRGR